MAKKTTPVTTAPRAAAVVEMGTVCELDEAGVLVAKRSVPVAALENYRPKANEVVFLHPVDTQPGRYRWTGSAFLPKGSDVSAAIQSQPNLILGIMRGLEAVVAQGVINPVPAELQTAIDWYNGTIDGRR